MKKILIPSFLALGALLLVSCDNKIEYQNNLDKYILNNIETKKAIIPAYEDGFKILQLTDIHFSTSTDIIESKKYLKNLISEVKKHTNNQIDLIEITGDSFMLSNTKTVESLLEILEEFKIPYATTWGNHDNQGNYNPSWLRKKYVEAKHSLYYEVLNDNLSGRSNYVLNLEKNNEVKWQIFHIDSGASYRESGLDLKFTYEYINKDQLDWLSKIHIDNVPSLAYYHIPGIDFSSLLEEAKDTAKFFKFEGPSSSKCADALKLEEVFKENNIVASFMGHDHNNDLTFTSKNGLIYGYGVKTGKELYYKNINYNELSEGENAYQINSIINEGEEFDLIGASLVTLHDNGTIDLEHLYYNEGTNENFVRWVKYND